MSLLLSPVLSKYIGTAFDGVPLFQAFVEGESLNFSYEIWCEEYPNIIVSCCKNWISL